MVTLTIKQVGEVTELLHKLQFFASKEVQEALSIAICCLHDRLQIVRDIEHIEKNTPDEEDISGYTKEELTMQFDK